MKRSYHSMAELFKKVTGVSIPIFGISWNPSPAEVTIAKKLLTFLSDRRILFSLYSHEQIDYGVESLLKIRERLTQDLELLDPSSELGQSLKLMREACRDFLDREQLLKKTKPQNNSKLYLALNQLRKTFAINIAKISAQYGIDLDKELANLVERFANERTKS